jgi:hypothetical protein
MGRLLAALVVLAIAVAGLGYYLGWFGVATENTSKTTNINVTVDKEKIQEDAEKAKEKVQDAGQKVKESIGKKE